MVSLTPATATLWVIVLWLEHTRCCVVRRVVRYMNGRWWWTFWIIRLMSWLSSSVLSNESTVRFVASTEHISSAVLLVLCHASVPSLLHWRASSGNANSVHCAWVARSCTQAHYFLAVVMVLPFTIHVYSVWVCAALRYEVDELICLTTLSSSRLSLSASLCFVFTHHSQM